MFGPITSKAMASSQTKWNQILQSGTAEDNAGLGKTIWDELMQGIFSDKPMLGQVRQGLTR